MLVEKAVKEGKASLVIISSEASGNTRNLQICAVITKFRCIFMLQKRNSGILRAKNSAHQWQFWDMSFMIRSLNYLQIWR